MSQPNMLIIRVQKCGTTWLHYALNKSRQLYGRWEKELNYWNKQTRGDFADYCRHFEGGTGRAVSLRIHSALFRLPRNRLNIAKAIRAGLGDIPLLLMLRNLVDRYLSSVTH